MSTNWEKNPDYPMTFTVCKECGSEGLMKLAWDLHGYLCVDAKPCLARVSQQYKFQVDDEFKPYVEEVEGETVFMGGLDDENAATFVEAVNSAALVDSFERPKPVVSLPDPDPGNQIFQCSICDVIWQRPATRGRPPKICPDCR